MSLVALAREAPRIVYASPVCAELLVYVALVNVLAGPVVVPLQEESRVTAAVPGSGDVDADLFAASVVAGETLVDVGAVGPV